jgi:hypothetical protein
MNRVTSVDLYMQYHKDTGNVLDVDNRFSRQSYVRYLEEKYLEKLNEEKEREELFNQTAIFDDTI